MPQNSLNNILLAEQNKLQSEVKALEERLGSVSSEAQNRQNALNKELSEQNKNLSQKQARLKLISDAFQAVRSQQESLLIQLTKLVEDVNDFDLEVQMVDRTIVLIFYDKFNFNGPSALSTSALRKLDQLVKILLDKTHLTVQIVGHTGPDVAIVDKRWTDPLDFSMFKAGILTRYRVPRVPRVYSLTNSLHAIDSLLNAPLYLQHIPSFSTPSSSSEKPPKATRNRRNYQVSPVSFLVTG